MCYWKAIKLLQNNCFCKLEQLKSISSTFKVQITEKVQTHAQKKKDVLKQTFHFFAIKTLDINQYLIFLKYKNYKTKSYGLGTPNL